MRCPICGGRLYVVEKKDATYYPDEDGEFYLTPAPSVFEVYCGQEHGLLAHVDVEDQGGGLFKVVFQQG